MIIKIPGNPIPLQRARTSKNRFYDPQYTAKKNFASYVKEISKETMIKAPIYLYAEFHFQIPTSWSKKKKALMLKKNHIQRPDTSNCIKFVEDALNGIAWEDDSQISDIRAFKVWDNEAYTLLEIDQLE